MGLFTRLGTVGFGDAILPLVPVGAKMAAGFEKFAGAGKAPGIKFNGAWAPKRDWRTYRAPLAEWDKWGANIGLRSDNFPGIDIDVLDEGLAADIQALALRMLGPAPVRVGAWPKRLLVYRLDGESFGKRSVDLGAAGKVEVLGAGQQYVIWGTHPKTLLPYRYVGPGLGAFGSLGLTAVTVGQVDAFLAAVADWADVMGLDAAVASGAGTVAARDQSELQAPSVAAVRRLMEGAENALDYDAWVKMAAAIKAACAGLDPADDGFDIFADFSFNRLDGVAADEDVCRAKWDSLGPPYKVGWGFLVNRSWLLGETVAPGSEFTEVEGIETAESLGLDDMGFEGAGDGSAAVGLARLEREFVWVKETKRMVRLSNGDMYDREQFNVDHNWVGDPADGKKCAWARLQRSSALTKVAAPTYLPGHDRIVLRQGRRLLNTWRGPNLVPIVSTEDEVRPWLDHLAYIAPIESERRLVLQFLAYIIQHPAEKVHFALVIKGGHGTGKDTLLKPVMAALGEHNCANVSSDALLDGNNVWALDRRLVVGQEMVIGHKRDAMQKLKPLMVCPPDTITINQKFVPKYDIPNIFAAVMMTNLDDALAIEDGDRRFFVIQSPDRKREREYYVALHAWLEEDGLARVAGYLGTVDLTGFDAKGDAPETAAKDEMREMTRDPLTAFVRDAIAEEAAPFETDLVLAGDIRSFLDARFGRHLSAQKVAKLLIKAGAEAVCETRIPSLGGGTFRLWAVRRATMYRGQATEGIRELFLKQKTKIAVGVFVG